MNRLNYLKDIKKSKPGIWSSFFLYILGLFAGILVAWIIAVIFTYIGIINGYSGSLIKTLLPPLLILTILGIPPWQYFILSEWNAWSLFVGAWSGFTGMFFIWYLAYYP